MPAVEANTKQIGDYTLSGKPLGSGGMATVYLVEKAGKKFAAKVLHKHLMRERKTVERFKQEFNIGLKMKANPAFVKMIELLKHDGCWTIIMEFVPGITLHDVITKLGPLSSQEAVAITYELAAALDSFHLKDFIHRDLKPCNIIISPNGTVKIMDYGVTRDLGTNLTKTGTAVGTPLYMAPEQICGSKSTDCRCDLYSLGLILYRMLSRKDAHRMKNNFEFMELVEKRMKKPVVPIKGFEEADLFEFMEVCLTPNPDERYSTSGDFCAALAKTKAYSSRRRPLIKQLLITIEKNNNKKPSANKIDRTIVRKPQRSLLSKLVLISALAAILSAGTALYLMGSEKFFSVLKQFFYTILLIKSS